jgi:hypothetical protein
MGTIGYLFVLGSLKKKWELWEQLDIGAIG